MLLGQPASEIFYWMTYTGNAWQTRLILFVLNPTNFFGLASIQTRIERKTDYYLYESIELETRKLILPQKFPVRLSAVLCALHLPISVMWRMWLSTNFDFNLKTNPISISRCSIDVFCTHSPWYRWYRINRYSVGTINFDVNKSNINIKRRAFQPKNLLISNIQTTILTYNLRLSSSCDHYFTRILYVPTYYY